MSGCKNLSMNHFRFFENLIFFLLFSSPETETIFFIMRISVEGNMGAGKSTFLRYFEEESKIKLQDLKLDFSQEPINQWSSLGSGKEDLLKLGIL